MNMSKDKLTAVEISDDVQQTFDNVTNSYRNLLCDRIEQHAKEFAEYCVNSYGFDDSHINELYQQFKEQK